VPAIPSWLLEPLWDQFAALLPDRPVYDPAHPLGCHRPRIADRVYDSQKTRDELAARGMTGQIAHKGDKAPVQAGQRWHVERTNAWHNAFNRLQRCYERREDVIDAFFDLADAIITVRSLIRQAWTTHRWDTRPAHRR
jgi:transposase